MKIKSILHVTESLGGGVTTAIIEYVKNSQQCRHYLLANVRGEAKIELGEQNLFKEVIVLPKNPVRAAMTIRRAFQKLNPSYIHLHSSYAGLYGRLSFIDRTKIIYTPHCYGFERRDLNIIKRSSIYIAEQILSIGGYCIAGVSPREVSLGKSMIGTKKAHYLPNYAEPTVPKTKYIGSVVNRKKKYKVAMVGRLSPQKDPYFFLNVYKLVRQKNDNISFVWLGGGDEFYYKMLTDEGIHVTGWVDHKVLLENMMDADIYLHSAKWEGNPMSMLEAASLNLPIIARDIPSLRSLGLSKLCKKPIDAKIILSDLADPSKTSDLYFNTNILKNNFTKEKQVKALEELYK
jgi:glycosyltransferase involved in cell wall biosynthesis